jgi:hypothetical protein
MSMMIPFLISFLNFSIANSAECPHRIDLYKGVQAESFWSKKTLSCAVKISPTLRRNGWSDYSFFSDGRLLVTEHFAKGLGSRIRVFYVFPRLRHPTYEFSPAGVQVTDSANRKLVFAYKTALVTKASKLNLTSVENKTRRSTSNRIILEMKSEQSRIFDSRSQTCAVENNSLFAPEYSTDAYGKRYMQSLVFRFSRDREFGRFLSKICPRLHISSLFHNYFSPLAQTTSSRTKKSPKSL